MLAGVFALARVGQLRGIGVDDLDIAVDHAVIVKCHLIANLGKLSHSSGEPADAL